MLKTLVPNINVLRQSRVPQASISLLMVCFPCTAHMKHSKFLEALKTARGIGFDPLKTNLIHALGVLLNTNKTMKDSKFKVYVNNKEGCTDLEDRLPPKKGTRGK
uniref:Uncharacterized protein n=1 Tax=Cajanus cajan TaxID=3821 RepID=A0A151RW00_CAJCA|nr:hypothetical protein KK1_031676 [Cajanus cajan]